MSKKGDILIGVKTVHPIIFLQKVDEYFFYGCMLTHANTNNYKNNIALLSKHFKKYDDNGNKFKVTYDDTYIVNLTLIKKTEWGPFEKAGELTKEGIDFIENQLRHSNTIEWRKYLSSK